MAFPVLQGRHPIPASYAGVYKLLLSYSSVTGRVTPFSVTSLQV